MPKLAKYRAQTRVFLDAGCDSSAEQSLKPAAIQKCRSLPAHDLSTTTTATTTTATATTTTQQPRRRRMSLLVPAALAKPLVQDYNRLVEDYNKIKTYAKQPDGEYLTTTLCLLCEATRPQIVFFPCQHMCMCHGCLLDHDVLLSDETGETLWTACMLCRHEIRMMLPHTGNEETKYWQWVSKAESTTLPPDFKEEFQEAATKLHKAITSSSSLTPKAATFHEHVRSVSSSFVPSTTPQSSTMKKPPPLTRQVSAADASDCDATSPNRCNVM